VAAAAVVLAAAAVPSMVDRGSGPVQPAPTPQAPEFAEPRPTYVAASTIMYGDRAVDVSPYTPSAIVQTDAGFVFSSTTHDVYLADGDSVERIGTTEPADGQVLAADGPYAAWVDWTSGDSPELVVYNTVERSEALRTDDGTLDSRDWRDQPAVEVVDDGQVFWHNADGVVVSDIASGADPIVLKAGATSEWLFDVVDGWLAHSTLDDQATTVSRETAGDEPFFPGLRGRLSPDARYVATTTLAGQVQVYDVAAGDEVTPRIPRYTETGFVGWLDDDRFTAWGYTRDLHQRGDLLVCTVSGGGCSVEAAGVTPVGPDGYDHLG
jgi:hypothetical protein